jgi:hypothetical protein
MGLLNDDMKRGWIDIIFTDTAVATCTSFFDRLLIK